MTMVYKIMGIDQSFQPFLFLEEWFGLIFEILNLHTYM